MTKKIFAGALAGLMVISSASALACDKDSFVSYDIANSQGRYGKIYYCPEIGRSIINGYASTVEWVHAFYEAEYPHKEVQTLVLDGKNTKMTRYSGNYADAKVKLVADFWEAKAPYDVYHRLYSSLEGGAYKPSDIVGYAGAQENVKVSNPVVGFDKYVVVDGKVKNYEVVYNQLSSQVANAPAGELDALVNQYYAAVTDKDGNFTEAFMKGNEADWKYDMFYDAIAQYTWEKLEGPDYYTGATQTIVPMQILGDKLDQIAKGKASKNEFHPDYYDNTIAAKTRNSQDVKWVTVGYEKEFPYRIYQVLCVNGVLLNGANVETPALGQTKIGEEVIANYDPSVLKGADNIYTIHTENVEKRPAEVDFDLVNEKNEIKTNKLVVKDYITPGYEDTIRLTQDVMVDNVTSLPYVFRYTGGYAHPTVEWKVAWPEAEYPYTIYEEKYLDGVATGIYRSTETTATAIPEVTEANPAVGNGIRVLKVTLSGDNIQDSCLHDALIADGYEFIVSGENTQYYRLPEILYPGHEFKGSHSTYYYGANNQYEAELVLTDWEDAQKALLNK